MKDQPHSEKGGLKMSRCKPKGLFLTFAAVAAMAATPVFAATTTWTNVTSNGTWSTVGNWSTTPVPGDDVLFGSNTSGITRLVSTVDSGWSSANRTVNNISFTGNGTKGWNLNVDNGVTLNIAGGITNSGTDGVIPLLSGNLNFTANQTINVGTKGINTPSGTWTSAANTKLTIANTDNAAQFQFGYGFTTAGFLGSFELAGGALLSLTQTNQYGRLGTNAFYVNGLKSPGVYAAPVLILGNSSNAASGIFANNIEFSNFGVAAAQGFRIQGPGNPTNPFTITMSGNWSGDIGGGNDSTSGGSGIRFTAGTNNTTNLRYLLTGNNTGLTSSLADKDTGKFAIDIARGMVVVDSDNALGAGNTLLVGIGSGNTNAAQTAGLLAANGRTISSDIRVFKNTGNATQSLILGVDGTGTSATFASNIYLDSSSVSAGQVPSLQLTAGAGSVVTFSGNIQNQDAVPGANVVPVTINGGGIVSLNGNNTYTGATTVEAGTTLRGTGSLTSSLTVNGILAPGNSIGTLVVGNTTFGSGSSFAVELGAGASDLLTVNGNLNITLATLNLSGLADNVTSYTIATYTGSLTGNFTSIVGMPGGYTLDYGTGSNSAIMLMVPEPGTWALLAFSLTTVMILRRRSTMPDRRNGA